MVLYFDIVLGCERWSCTLTLCWDVKGGPVLSLCWDVKGGPVLSLCWDVKGGPVL